LKSSKPINHWVGGFTGKEYHPSYRAAKVTNNSERIMKIKDAEKKYGIELK
jgi:hypothetical protein